MTLAVLLVFLGALGATGAPLTGSWLLVTWAGALGVLLGAAAVRLTYAELVCSRRDAAADRSAQAQDYAAVTAARVAEHATYVAGVQHQIAEHEEAVEQLELALISAQRRAAIATHQRGLERHRVAALHVHLREAEQTAGAAVLRIGELERQIDVLRAELEAVSSWRQIEPLRKHA